MHNLIHDKGRTSHITAVFHQRDKRVEYQNLWEEHDHGAYTGNDAVNQHILERTVGYRGADGVAQPAEKGVDPVHRVLSEGEGDLKHQEEQEDKDGEPQPFVRDNSVYQMGGPIGVGLVAFLVARLL